MSDNKPKVSILIAVYNGGEALRGSIGSLQNQTLKDIEIVCVNDCSSDNSVEIINEYAKNDSRVKLVSFDENRGTICARKAGVEAATGEYLMFMDQDDTYKEFACEELYNLIREKDVEVLHYRSQVIPVPPTTEKAAEWQENFLRPYDGFLYGKDVFDYCFGPDPEDTKIWNEYTWNVWNKIYKTELCKKSMKDCKEDYVINGDDVYVYMLIAYNAKSYFGDAQGKYYHVYSYGTGLMGHYKLSMKRFYTICRRMTGYRNEEIFFEEKGNKDEYLDALGIDFLRSLNGIVTRWYNRLSDEDHKHGFDMMMEHLSKIDIIKGFHKHVNTSYDNLAVAVTGSQSTRITKKEVKTVGVYFSKSRGLPKLVNLDFVDKLTEAGYKVVIFTEEDANLNFGEREFYTLPGEIEGRIFDYPIQKREEYLDKCLREMNIDAYIYTGRKNKLLVHDFLNVKCNGIPFIMDSCELSLYNRKDNEDSKGFYRYLRFLSCVDAVLLANINVKDVIETLDVNYYTSENALEVLKDVVADGYLPKRNLMNAHKVVLRKYVKILNSLVSSDITKKAFKLEKIYSEFEQGDKKQRKAIIKKIETSPLDDIEVTEEVSQLNEIKLILDFFKENLNL